MPKSAALDELLDVAEDITRSASITLRSVKAYFISDSLMRRLKRAVTQYRPTPYHLEGGRKVRSNPTTRKHRSVRQRK